MSDEHDPAPSVDTPSVDVFEQLRAAGDAAMPALLSRIDEAVQGGGKVSRRHRCTACGEVNTVEIEVADVEEIRKLVEMFAKLRLQAPKEDEASKIATKLLRDRSELSDAELAEYIAKLEADLGRTA